MSIRHLEGMIFIHLKRDYSSAFVSEPHLVVLDQYLFSCIQFCLVILMQVIWFRSYQNKNKKIDFLIEFCLYSVLQWWVIVEAAKDHICSHWNAIMIVVMIFNLFLLVASALDMILCWLFLWNLKCAFFSFTWGNSKLTMGGEIGILLLILISWCLSFVDLSLCLIYIYYVFVLKVASFGFFPLIDFTIL